VLEGFRQSSGPAIAVMDADGSHPPELLPALLGPIVRGEAEFVLASRFVPGGSSPGLVGSRRVMSRVAGTLARPLVTVHDPMSGFFALHRRILARADLAPLGFKIALELLVRCRPDPVREVPYCFTHRFAGESKLDSGEVSGFLRHLGRLYLARFSSPGRASSTR
jgi:dolichol-phosphate mannosyltransferase